MDKTQLRDGLMRELRRMTKPDIIAGRRAFAEGEIAALYCRDGWEGGRPPAGGWGGSPPAAGGRSPQRGRPWNRAPGTPPKLFHSPWGREERPTAFPPTRQVFSVG